MGVFIKVIGKEESNMDKARCFFLMEQSKKDFLNSMYLKEVRVNLS
jgi:hypothetical protein